MGWAGIGAEHRAREDLYWTRQAKSGTARYGTARYGTAVEWAVVGLRGQRVIRIVLDGVVTGVGHNDTSLGGHGQSLWSVQRCRGSVHRG